jgi:glycosyltransferase involved in cell wall biosynthesis
MYAVESVLRQSYPLLEIIVVVDGPDPETVQALKAREDERLRIIALEENVGGSEARNIGVRAARGEWVAFLDDDDLWVPEKLETQVMLAANSQADYPIVSSRLIERGPKGDRLLPRRLYMSGESVGDYLFCRHSFAYGDGMLQTSTLLTKRNLLLDAPFLKGLKRHQDWDWLLKVAGRPDVEIVMSPEILTVMRVEEQGESVSRSVDWGTSLAWAKQSRRLMSAKAYASFISTECVPRARKSGAGLFPLLGLLGECVWNGRPSLRQMALFFSFCMLPKKVPTVWRNRMMRSVAAIE